MAFTENHKEFLHTDEWAESVAITGFGNVTGVFRDEYAEVLEMEGSRPMFECDADDVPGIAQRTALTRTKNGKTYSVAEIQDDGQGWVILVLEEDV